LDDDVLTIYNTLAREKQVFAPIDPKNVRMYVCGPTVYDFAHIGNGRPVIVFDVLFRLLRHLYGESHVTYVRNITDVEDKIIARAAERGVSIRELTEGTAQDLPGRCAGVGLPHDLCRAAGHRNDGCDRRHDRAAGRGGPRLCSGRGTCAVRRTLGSGLRAVVAACAG
jgi:cysteinyl-tRNA synthetase